jgi:hypothetical protein
MVPHENLALSYGAFGVVNGSAKFVSSTAVGMVWTAVSPVLGFGLAALLNEGRNQEYRSGMIIYVLRLVSSYETDSAVLGLVYNISILLAMVSPGSGDSSIDCRFRAGFHRSQERRRQYRLGSILNRRSRPSFDPLSTIR